MGINLRQNKNERSSGYGNYYPKEGISSAVTTKTFTKSSGGGGGFNS